MRRRPARRPVAKRFAVRPCPVPLRRRGEAPSAGHSLPSREKQRGPHPCGGRLPPRRPPRTYRLAGGGSGTATIPSSRGRCGGVAGGDSAVGRFGGGAGGFAIGFGGAFAGVPRRLGRRPLHRSPSPAAARTPRRRHDHDLSASPATYLPARKLCVNVEHVAGRAEEANDHLFVSRRVGRVKRVPPTRLFAINWRELFHCAHPTANTVYSSA